MDTLFQDFSLCSDTCSGLHPRLAQAISNAGSGFASSYGEDALTEQAVQSFKNIFGDDIEVFFVFNGTGANVLALAAMAGRAAGIVCADTAHINVHETGAVERLVGAKLLASPHTQGKLLPQDIHHWAAQREDNHVACPEVVSISQTTEFGTVYTPGELKALCDAAHQHGMTLHMDGARFANAVAALDADPREISINAGVDVMCFGGTKNGFAFGEAIVFFNTALAKRFSHLHKQYLQLASKNRFIAAQFKEALDTGLWLDNARQANQMAARLAEAIRDIDQLALTLPVDSNQIFLRVPQAWIPQLEEKSLAGVESDNTTRWVTSFSTTPAQIDEFAGWLHTL